MFPERPTSLTSAAVQAARHGFPVFPLKPRQKTPLRSGWQRSATTDLDKVEETWDATPEANVGIRCGSGLVVIEADSIAGQAALREYDLPLTTTVRTARGVHYYLRGRSRNRVRVLPDVDVRGHGGYVVGAGSIHPDGPLYSYVVPPWEHEPAELSDSLIELLKGGIGGKAPHLGSSSTTAVLPEGLSQPVIPEGTRNDALFRIACSLRGRSGLTNEEMLAALLTINAQRCQPPLGADEVQLIAGSAANYKVAPLWALDPLAFADDPRLSSTERLVLIALARHADAEGKCYPSIARLRDTTGINRNAIQRAIDGLESVGRVEVERGGPGRSNRYRLLA